MRQGNLIELSTALTNSAFIPAGCVDTVNKVINASCIDPVARAIQNYYPLPNIASELANAGVRGSFGNLTLSGRPPVLGGRDRSGGNRVGSNDTRQLRRRSGPRGFDQTIDHWMDINAFAPLEVGTYGNCPYKNVRGPGLRVEFRIETFNLFNNVNFNLPAANVNTPASFGKITGTIGNPREMQFGLKLYF